ncbi:MAG TPA: TatD family hydrolase [Candidatus Binatia bacterium]|nr:TatD family hydrolase [Candidatus Binatia bacterium]
MVRGKSTTLTEVEADWYGLTMLFDAHVHIDKYGADLNRALQEIRTHDVFTIAVAMDVPSYKRTLEIAEECELVLPTFGIHPRRAPEYVDRLRELNPLIEQSPALGEIGLDFHWVEESSQYPAQLKVLEYFLAAAREQKKLVNLHTKGAEKEIIDLLERYDIQRAIVHWYSGPLDVLRALIQFGAYFTIGVEVSYSDTIQTIAREIPDQLLLTETDNPGGLKWLKGVVGMPKEVHNVLDGIAQARKASPQRVAQTIHANFLRMINTDPWLKDLRTLLLPPPY